MNVEVDLEKVGRTKTASANLTAVIHLLFLFFCNVVGCGCVGVNEIHVELENG
jgi:hypothetical protein